MDVLIKGMEMPTSCGYCPLWHEARDGDECYLGASLTEYQKRPDDCPLVPIPPHGRLGDLDALEELVIKRKYDCAGASAYGAISELHKSWGLHDAELMIEAAPTIIPEDEMI